jgi:glycosyltransferase involved in cell wall biosynthesis
MRVRTPSRHKPYPWWTGRVRLAADAAIEAVSAGLGTLFVEGMVLGRVFGGVLRPAMLHLLAPRLAMLERGFDLDFYLRQFDDQAQRRRVARAPLLHYALLGWRTRRAPAPGFDPAFYRRRNPDRPPGVDPLFHHLEKPASQMSPRNEVEARTDRPPWREGAEAVLVFHHGRGGGSSHFLDLFERDIENTGRNVLRARMILKAPTLAVIGDRTFDLASRRDLLIQFARERRVTRLVVNHVIDRPMEMMEWVRDLGGRLGVPYDVVLHDYFMLCPRIDLITGEGAFCDVAPPETCVRCVVTHGAEVREFDPLAWRRDHLAFLQGADRIVAPSDDVAARMRRYLPRPIAVWEPESDAGYPPEHTPRVCEAEPLRIVTLGALNVGKGLRVVQALADAAGRAGAPLQVSVLGPASEPLPRSVAVRGTFLSEDLGRLLQEAAPHAVFLPAIWPETWSFVLTAALKQGLPVIAFDIGAPAARLRRLGRGLVLPTALAADTDRLLATLLELRDRWIVR